MRSVAGSSVRFGGGMGKSISTVVVCSYHFGVSGDRVAPRALDGRLSVNKGVVEVGALRELNTAGGDLHAVDES